MAQIMAELKYKKRWLLIGYAMVAFVIYSSLTSSPVSVGIAYSDKFLHTVGYFGLMGWFLQIYHKKAAVFLLAVIFIVMGISLEFLQDWGGVRHFEVNDMIANSSGVLLAWVLVFTPFPGLLLWFEKRFVTG
ncbi:hypothetical protein MNBD_GAMMA10-2603 [hydrothermal vent metagenome]|uniref:VanZ-like domain-containing protein n=1 Tax=hydrothermal vent metagenome TaxID=652676 RepID=A0A3B0Y159_9ZZZZ